MIAYQIYPCICTLMYAGVIKNMLSVDKIVFVSIQ